MAEELTIDKNLNRAEIYRSLIPQIEALVGDEEDIIANLANTVAALKQAFDFFWVGFYLVKDDELVLGPFQGPVACTRIKKGKGVCGTSWAEEKTVVVEDVDQFPGHIACSADSRSEIVLVLKKNNEVFGVLDIDSDRVADFDKTDQEYLEQLLDMIAERCL